jgi:hypothetical protein
MRLMKMMDYDFKVAHYWQYNVSEIIAYRSCCCCITVKGSDTMFLHHSPSSSSDASQFRQWVKLFWARKGDVYDFMLFFESFNLLPIKA